MVKGLARAHQIAAEVTVKGKIAEVLTRAVGLLTAGIVQAVGQPAGVAAVVIAIGFAMAEKINIQHQNTSKLKM